MIHEILTRVRERRPLVHHITNWVTIYNCAAASRALGALPVMAHAPGEAAGYPTLCKGRFQTAHATGYLFEDPVSLDATAMLPALRKAGVTALKIEGRQRGRAYIERVVRNFRTRLAELDDGVPAPLDDLVALTEGQSTTAGAYRKSWR